MRLHDRYLFRELLTPLAFCLGGFSVLWLADFFFTRIDEMQAHKFQLREGVEYFLALSPEFFVTALPIALLLSLLYALTHHARHHELTALRAAGVGLWRLCAPYFVVGLAASGIYFLLNEGVVPRAADWAEAIKARHVPSGQNPKNPTRYTNIDFRTAHAKRLWHIGEYDSAARTMVNPRVTWTLPDGSQRQLVAERAFRDGTVWVFLNVQQFAQAGPQARLVQLGNTNRIALPEFDESPDQILSNSKMNDSQSLLGSRNADIPLQDLREYFTLHPDLPPDVAHQLLTKYYGRLAAPWTCLVVVFIAIPFGAQSGRRNLFFGVAGSIFICFFFFVLQQVSLAFGLNGLLPPWLAAWLPNLLFAAAGTAMILRTR
jgi:lipopolysaccharide export system permease protein